MAQGASKAPWALFAEFLIRSDFEQLVALGAPDDEGIIREVRSAKRWGTSNVPSNDKRANLMPM